jgi:hypothetical protein
MNDRYVYIVRVPRTKNKVKLIVINEKERQAHALKEENSNKKKKNYIKGFKFEGGHNLNMISYVDALKNAKEHCKENGYTLTG